ncbi:MAG: dATP/dGTP diphosphohydrolase domain-containing protein [Nitrosopumilaceae archaeon]
MINNKSINPKDRVGSKKLPLDLVPSVVNTNASLAFLEGALKYGAYNWRVSGVRTSIYKAALERHLGKFWNGEWADVTTNVPHLASIIACAGIILDANLCGKLIDDRPPPVDMGKDIEQQEKIVVHLQELFKNENPKQY